MFTLRQYLTTLADTHGLTRTLGEIEVCRDGKGRICYSAGNSAVVFRIRCEGRVRSLRCYMHHPRHLAEIYGEKLLPQELFIYTSPAGGVWVDVVLSDWIEGVTLHEAVAAAAEAGDTARLRRFAAAFDRMAAALTADDWAHGDLKPENIVADNWGRLHLIDFDAMFLPAFAGRHSPELGTAAFQHPARTVRDFDASLDDYPAALISTALHALALDPTLTGCSSRRRRSGPTRRSARCSRSSSAGDSRRSTGLHGCSVRLRSGCRDCRNCSHWRRKQRKRMK